MLVFASCKYNRVHLQTIFKIKIITNSKSTVSSGSSTGRGGAKNGWSRALLLIAISGLLSVYLCIVAIVSTLSTQLDSFDDRQCADRNYGTPSVWCKAFINFSYNFTCTNNHTIVILFPSVFVLTTE